MWVGTLLQVYLGQVILAVLCVHLESQVTVRVSSVPNA